MIIHYGEIAQHHDGLDGMSDTSYDDAMLLRIEEKPVVQEMVLEDNRLTSSLRFYSDMSSIFNDVFKDFFGDDD